MKLFVTMNTLCCYLLEQYAIINMYHMNVFSCPILSREELGSLLFRPSAVHLVTLKSYTSWLDV